jgi:hypothetical protein
MLKGVISEEIYKTIIPRHVTMDGVDLFDIS